MNDGNTRSRGKGMAPNHAQNQAIQAASYALVKYGSQQIQDFNFTLCSRIAKGGVVRVWLERGRNLPENHNREVVAEEQFNQ